MSQVAPNENSFNSYYLIGSLGMKRNKTKPLPTKSARFTRGDKHVKGYTEHSMRLLAPWLPPKHVDSFSLTLGIQRP